jgi:hypothetical protein
VHLRQDASLLLVEGAGMVAEKKIGVSGDDGQRCFQLVRRAGQQQRPLKDLVL